MILQLTPEKIRDALPEFTDSHGYQVDLDEEDRLTISQIGPPGFGSSLLAVARWMDSTGSIVAKSGAIHPNIPLSNALYSLLERAVRDGLEAIQAAFRAADAEFVKIFYEIGLPTDSAQIKCLPEQVQALINRGAAAYMLGERDMALQLFHTAASLHRGPKNTAKKGKPNG